MSKSAVVAVVAFAVAFAHPLFADTFSTSGTVTAPSANLHTGGGPSMNAQITTGSHSVTINGTASSSHNITWNLIAEIDSDAAQTDYQTNQLIDLDGMGAYTHSANGNGTMQGSLLKYTGNHSFTPFRDIQCSTHGGHKTETSGGANFAIINP